MITVNYETIRKDVAFGGGFQKLRSCRTFPVKVAYTVGKIVKKIESEWKESEKLWQDILERHAVKDEKGARIIENGQFKVTDEAAFEKDARDFMALSFTIDWTKLTLNDLESLKEPALTPDELMALEPLINHGDVVPLKGNPTNGKA